MEKLVKWCKFDDYICSLTHWPGDNYITGWLKTYDERYNVLWEAYLAIYTDDSLHEHELKVVIDRSVSNSYLVGTRLLKFGSVDDLLDAAEEKRREFVRRYYRKTEERKLENLLEELP